jgi:multiple sugar transport system permease protein
MAKMKFATKQSIYGITFIIPCMIVLILMMLYPLIQTILFSFSTITLPTFSLKYNGVNNFIKVFSRKEVPTIILNTILWTFGSVVLRLFLGMITALVMNSDFPGVKVLRIVVLIPWTVPSIVSANSWRWIFQGDFGVINGMLKAGGFSPVTWIGSSDTAMGSILVAATWAGYPFVMMMLLSAMQGLPRDHFEAAMVDGANAFQRFWHIIIPGIKPVLLIIIALETINAINAFDMIYNMTGGGPGNATEIFGLFIYRLGFNLLDFAGASAVSMVLILVALVFCVIYVLLQLGTAKRGSMKE